VDIAVLTIIVHLAHVVELVAVLDVDVLNVPLVKLLLLVHGMYHNVLHVQRENITQVVPALVALPVNIRHTPVK
jgi:hypothetical protein